MENGKKKHPVVKDKVFITEPTVVEIKADAVTANKKKRTKLSAKLIAFTGMMTAMVTVATLLGFSTAQFYFNVGDTVIMLTAAIFGPVPAMLAGGLGSFFADMIIYPATMLFTLLIKGIEGLICGLSFALLRKFVIKKQAFTVLSVFTMAFSSLYMMTGYFICQTFFYGTYAAAIVALPMDAVQAACSTALATIMLFVFKFIDFRQRLHLDKPSAATLVYTREHVFKRKKKDNSI